MGSCELLPASCYQFLWLPPQATHSHHRVSLVSSNEDMLLAAPGFRCVFPGISAKLVRSCEITENLHRCKKFLGFFENFCKREMWYEGNEQNILFPEDTGEHRGVLLLPLLAIHHSLDSIAKVKDVEIDQQGHADSAQAPVAKELCLVDGMECVNGFHFDNDSAFDDRDRLDIRLPVCDLHTGLAMELQSQPQGLGC